MPQKVVHQGPARAKALGEGRKYPKDCQSQVKAKGLRVGAPQGSLLRTGRDKSMSLAQVGTQGLGRWVA